MFLAKVTLFTFKRVTGCEESRRPSKLTRVKVASPESARFYHEALASIRLARSEELPPNLNSSLAEVKQQPIDLHFCS